MDTIEPSVQRGDFRHPGGAGALVEVVEVRELRTRFDESEHSIFEPTRLDFHLFQCVTQGKGCHWVDYQRVPLEVGDFLHVRPEQVHAFDRTATHDALLLIFRPEGIPSTVSLRLAHPLRPAAVKPGPREVEHLLRLAGAMFEAQRSGTVFSRQETLRHLLAAVLSGAQSISDREQPLARGRASDISHAFETLIGETLEERRDLSWYASELSISTRTLSRACIEAFGRSAKKYLDGRVALEAKRLLVHTGGTVEQVGGQLGFSESTNFVKFFRRVEGETPQAFRRRVRVDAP